MFLARVGLTIVEIDEFATLEPICFIPPDDNNQDPDPNMHENPIPDNVEQSNPPISHATNRTAELDVQLNVISHKEKKPDF